MGLGAGDRDLSLNGSLLAEERIPLALSASDRFEHGGRLSGWRPWSAGIIPNWAWSLPQNSFRSPSYLKRFPLSNLKVDRSFVSDITSDPDDAAITSAIINMAHRLKLKVVAEGVETADQFAFLRSLKCDGMQGYLFSRPLTSENATELLVQKKGISFPRPPLLLTQENILSLLPFINKIK